MKGTGIRTNVRERGNIRLPEAPTMKGNGKTTRRTAKVSLIGETVPHTMECG